MNTRDQFTPKTDEERRAFAEMDAMISKYSDDQKTLLLAMVGLRQIFNAPLSDEIKFDAAQLQLQLFKCDSLLQVIDGFMERSKPVGKHEMSQVVALNSLSLLGQREQLVRQYSNLMTLVGESYDKAKKEQNNG